MRFLLDTCVVSDFAQGQAETLVRVKTSSPEDLAASALTEMEVAYGLLLNPKLANRLKPVMDAFFGAIRVLPYDPEGRCKGGPCDQQLICPNRSPMPLQVGTRLGRRLGEIAAKAARRC